MYGQQQRNSPPGSVVGGQSASSAGPNMMMQQHLALNAVLPGAVQLIQNAQGRVPDLNKAIKNYKPNELFVGNLSYFCEEKDLYALFEENGHVEDVRIIKNDSGTRSLMFGFVTMSTIHETREMEKLLNNQMFMGRKLR